MLFRKSCTGFLFYFWLRCHSLGLPWWFFIFWDIGWVEDLLFFPSRTILEVFYFGMVYEGSPCFVLTLVSELFSLVGLRF